MYTLENKSFNILMQIICIKYCSYVLAEDVIIVIKR